MAYTSRGRDIKAAADARSDLNVFAAVAALMESSLVSSKCSTAAERILKICRAEQQKCLVRYDQSVAKAGGGTYGR